MTNIFRHVISYFFIAFSLIGCATKLQMEAAIGNSQSVTELLEKGESISETSYRGWTALHYAAQGGQEGIVDLLVTKGAEINAQGNRGETALNLATYHCHSGCQDAVRKRGKCCQ